MEGDEEMNIWREKRAKKNQKFGKNTGLWVLSLLMNLHFIQQEKCIVLYSYTNLKKFAVERMFNII